METEIERTDPEVGYTWGHSEGTYYLRNEDDDFRGVSENVLKLLDDLATGEVTKEELPENASRIVERLERLGYLRPDAPVVRIVEPEDVRFWPRFALFGLLVALALYVAAREASVLGRVDEILTPVRLLVIVGLTVASFAIHEAGHHLASRKFFDPSFRIGTVNVVFPAAISTTNGAWMLPRNRRRWISLAGPFAEVVWLLTVSAAYYFVAPWSSTLRLFVVWLNASVLGSLNPLFHGDGYWLLVDTFNATNLRKRGIEDLRERRLTKASAYVFVSYVVPFGMFLLFVPLLLSWGTVGIAILLGQLALITYGVRDKLRVAIARSTA